MAKQKSRQNDKIKKKTQVAPVEPQEEEEEEMNEEMEESCEDNEETSVDERFVLRPDQLDDGDDEEIISETGSQSEKKSRSKDKDRNDSYLISEGKKFKEALQKRGVIYVSRIPPFMKPNKLRTIMSEYGEVIRLYIAEEDPIKRKKRKESGGNGSKQFTEGWVEFADKKIAKKVALSLNNTSIGATKGDYYHDDLWNLKYLKGFKWDQLTEKFAYERRVREHKLQAFMLQAKRANAEFSELFDKQKAQQHIEKRKKRKLESDESNESAGGHGSSNGNSNGNSSGNGSVEVVAPKRKFKQAEAFGFVHGEKNEKMNKNTLKQIFTSN